MYREGFPSKLKQARFNAGFSQQEVEDFTKIPRANLSRYENGKLEPNIETLGILADFYDVSVDWLLSTKGGKRT